MANNVLDFPGIAEIDAEQFFYTHCGDGDSTTGTAGFAIRAQSSDDETLRTFVEKFPSHQLPTEILEQKHPPEARPRRLACVHVPGARQMSLVHSSFLARDTTGRDFNFFSHFLIADKIPLRAAAAAWGASNWVTTYDAGKTKNLDSVQQFPQGGIGDPMLADYLAKGCEPSKDQSLAGVTIPRRISERSPADRRELLSAVMNTVMSNAAAGSEHVYINAEPGLVALLLYGAARLLPNELVDGLTFSTYESPDSLVRFQGARIVGTWTNNAEYLDEVRDRGPVIDTVTWSVPQIGSEIDDGGDDAAPKVCVEFLMACARKQLLCLAGKTHELARFDELVSPRSLREAIQLINLPGLAIIFGAIEKRERADAVRQWAMLARLIGTSDTPIDVEQLRESLDKMQRFSLGRRILERGAYGLWDKIRQLSLGHEKFQSQFRWILDRKEQQDQMRDAAQQALADRRVDEWVRHWQMLQSVCHPEDLAKRIRSVLVLPSGEPVDWKSYPFPERLTILEQFCGTLSAEEKFPESHIDLLSFEDAAQFEKLLSDRMHLTPHWLADAILYFTQSETAPMVAKALLGRRDLFQRFADGLQWFETRDANRLLNELVGAEPTRALEFIEACRACGVDLGRLDVRRTDATLSQAKVWLDDAKWEPSENIFFVTELLGPKSKTVREIWKCQYQKLSQELLLKDPRQKKRFQTLQKLRKQLKDRIPPDAIRTLDQWDDLLLELQKQRFPNSMKTAAALVAVSLMLGLVVGRLAGVIWSPKQRDAAAQDAGANSQKSVVSPAEEQESPETSLQDEEPIESSPEELPSVESPDAS